MTKLFALHEDEIEYMYIGRGSDVVLVDGGSPIEVVKLFACVIRRSSIDIRSMAVEVPHKSDHVRQSILSTEKHL